METVDEIINIKNIIKKSNFSEELTVGVTAGASTPKWIIEEVTEKMKEDNVMEEKIMNEVEAEVNTRAGSRRRGNHGRFLCCFQ